MWHSAGSKRRGGETAQTSSGSDLTFILQLIDALALLFKLEVYSAEQHNSSTAIHSDNSVRQTLSC